MQFTPYVFPHIAAAIVCIAVIRLAWKRRWVSAVRAFIILMAVICLWAVGNALELLSTSLGDMVFWANVEYLGILSIPQLWLRFALQYTGRDQAITWRRQVLLAIVPAIACALVWTDPATQLMRYGFHMETIGSFRYVAKSYGLWFYVTMIYGYALVLWATLALVPALIRSHYIYRAQGALFLVGALLPWLANVAYVLGFSPVPHMDLTPPAFAFSGLLVAFGLVRFQALDLVPAARDKVMECISDGVLVLDSGGRIIDLNVAAGSILGVKPAAALGPVGQRFDPGVRARLLAPQESRADVAVGDGDAYLDLRVTALRSQGQVTGWVVVMRDITAQRRAEQEREKVILELQEALERINTLRGLLPICANCKKVRDDSGYWRQVEEYVEAHLDVEFTHGICPECLAKLYPEYGGGPSE